MSAARRPRRASPPVGAAADPGRAVSRGPTDRFALAAALALVVVVLGTAIVVDPRAEAAFDAPKRLVAMVGLAMAAVCVLADAASGAGSRRPPTPAAVSNAAASGGASVSAAPGHVAPAARSDADREPVRRSFAWSGARRIVLIAAGTAATLVVAATLASPRPALARDAFRALAVYALALPLGASRALDGGRARWLLAAFVVGAVVNAVASLAQAAGATLFTTTLVAGRADTGAFLGNEGHVAQLVALASVGAGVAAWRAATPGGRAAALAALVTLVGALVVNRSLTALATAAAAGALVLVLRSGRRALLPLALAALVLVASVAAYPPMRARLAEAAAALGRGDWDAVTTYRLGPWSAAVEMVRERPLLGFGPGTFGAEFAEHRMRAEIRHRRRLVIPLVTSSFGEAHSDYLQAAAEWGIAAALAGLAAGATLLAALAARAAGGEAASAPHAAESARGAPAPRLPPGRAARRERDLTGAAVTDAAPHVGAGIPWQAAAGADEVLVLTALLAAGGVAALAWFPLQLPVVMVPLLLAAGRGWRLLAPTPAVAAAAGPAAWSSAPEPTPAVSPACARTPNAVPIALALAAAVAALALVAPEFRRAGAERRLARATAVLERVAAGGRIVPEARPQLAALAAEASAAAAASPADTRGLVAAGTAMLLAGDAPAARAHYRAALARGERAEIDLNLARAYAVEGRRDDGEAALLRAGWLSPTLLAVSLPERDRTRLEDALAALAARLRRGELAEPPALPRDDADAPGAVGTSPLRRDGAAPGAAGTPPSD